MFTVKYNEFGVSELNKVKVEHICNCAEGEDEEESTDIEIVERDPSYGECSENLYLSSLIDTEEDFDRAFSRNSNQRIHGTCS